MRTRGRAFGRGFGGVEGRAQPFAIFRRIYIWVFVLIALLGLLFAGITYLATTDFYEASTQLLNKDVAAHIAKFTSPYGKEGFDRQKADSVFQDAMVISPSAEVYFLDTMGRVIYFHGPASEIQRWQVSLEPLRRSIASGGLKHIDGPDPRDPSHVKIFSAAAVEGESGRLGYIYVVLGSRQYRSVTQMLYNSHVTPLALGAFLFIIATSLLLTLIYIRRIRIRFNDMMGVLKRFREGDFTARFAPGEKDDLAPVTESFNKMADLLLDNINRLTASEKERRDFMVNISHDLRTPLAIARGYGETLLLNRGPFQEGSQRSLSPLEEKEYGELVVSKIRQVESMVNQLFELSKMESASFEARKEPFIFSELVQEVIHAVAPVGDAGSAAADAMTAGADAGLAAEKRSRIDCVNCTDGSWVEADISMMERVIQNLVVNAVAYTSQEGLIRVSLLNEGAELVFRIGNEAPPLAPDLLLWINEGERSSRPAIGLAIVRKVLLLHGFAFEAEVGGGMNVLTFRMPVYAL